MPRCWRILFKLEIQLGSSRRHSNICISPGKYRLERFAYCHYLQLFFSIFDPSGGSTLQRFPFTVCLMKDEGSECEARKSRTGKRHSISLAIELGKEEVIQLRQVSFNTWNQVLSERDNVD